MESHGKNFQSAIQHEARATKNYPDLDKVCEYFPRDRFATLDRTAILLSAEKAWST